MSFFSANEKIKSIHWSHSALGAVALLPFVSLQTDIQHCCVLGKTLNCCNSLASIVKNNRFLLVFLLWPILHYRRIFKISRRFPVPIGFLRQISTISIRGGGLEDVLGLEDSFGSPWPWPWGVKSLALASNPPVLENWPVLGREQQLFASF